MPKSDPNFYSIDLQLFILFKENLNVHKRTPLYQLRTIKPKNQRMKEVTKN
jgi:hypothetical protein